MKKVIIILSILITTRLIFSITIPATTYTSNETWTLNNSPYIVTGDIVVNPNVTLTIQSGVVVKFDSNFGMTINGKLIAQSSSSSSPIVITGNTGNNNSQLKWKGIVFRNSNQSVLKYCKISFVSDMGALRFYNCTNITISNCDIFNNEFALNNQLMESYSAVGVTFNTGSDIVLENNSFYYNNSLFTNVLPGNVHGTAALCYNITNFKFKSNKIYNNSSEKGEGSLSIAYDDVDCGLFQIENNTIHNNSAEYGAGIYLRGESYVSQIYILNNEIKDNIAQVDGGGLYLSGNGYVVNNNVIINNKANRTGGGLYCNGSASEGNIAEIKDNIIRENNSMNAGGVYLTSVPKISAGTFYGYYNDICDNTISNNIATSKGGGIIACGVVVQTFYRNTIANNQSPWGAGFLIDEAYFIGGHNNIVFNKQESIGPNIPGDVAAGLVITGNIPRGMYSSNSYILLSNSILWGNKRNGANSGQVLIQNMIYTGVDMATFTEMDSYFTNCCIQNNENDSSGVIYQLAPVEVLNTVTEDPLFTDIYGEDWHIGDNSSCIGTGTNNNDIGVYPYNLNTNTSIMTYNLHERWNWIAFPKLQRDPETNDGDPINSVLSGLEDSGLQLTNDDRIFIDYLNPGWDDISIPEIRSTEGYKLDMGSTMSYSYIVPGKTINPNTLVDLQTNKENWTGYFIPGAATINEALGVAMNNLISIKTEKWAMTRLNTSSPWNLSTSIKFLNYGDMVALTVPSSVRDFSFVWGVGSVKKSTSVTKNQSEFIYETHADYIPIYVEYQGETPPSEIAVFANGVCKGAREFEGDVTQINAYFTEDDLNAEITIEFSYSSKGIQKKKMEFAIVNPNDQSLNYIPLLHKKGNSFYRVKISNKEQNTNIPMISYAQNYPNPFNPETTIFFNASKEGKVLVNIYNIKGQKIVCLFDGILDKGNHKISWNGKDSNGKILGSGIYLYKIVSGKQVIVNKMTLLK